MSKQREEFEAWYGKKPKNWIEAVKYNKSWQAWQQAQKVAVPDSNIVVNKGDYIELVRINRERQMINARLVEDVKILMARKNHYKKLSKSNSVPDGWVVVPREPTVEMISHGRTALSKITGTLFNAYKAMIEAGEKK